MPKVRFENEGIEVEVEPGTSILEAAEESGARVGSSCGGQCACSTCHVYVTDGADSLTEKSDAEEDRLDMAFEVKSESRLGCQARVGAEDVAVQISQESIKAWYDERPAERKKLAEQGRRP
jgi:2Fe-2S ferredoxin